MIYIIYAFTMSQHRSVYGKKVDALNKLLAAVDAAIKRGAQVISIRIYQ